ncbi:endonuclease [Spirochaetia bacterium]|nr:endonuclease [Spirochaetia bacterium]
MPDFEKLIKKALSLYDNITDVNVWNAPPEPSLRISFSTNEMDKKLPRKPAPEGTTLRDGSKYAFWIELTLDKHRCVFYLYPKGHDEATIEKMNTITKSYARIDGNIANNRNRELTSQNEHCGIKEWPFNLSLTSNYTDDEIRSKTKEAIGEMLKWQPRCIRIISDEITPPPGPKEPPSMDYINEYINMLEKSGNIILTGAPGTGKTYLAQDIAAQFIGITETDKEKQLEQLQKSGHYDFVQFHPSYDYTDFVEGLRAEELNGQVTFKLHDGIFKNFCKKAVENFSSEKEANNFDELYEKFVDDLLEKETSFETPAQKKKFHVEINSNRNCVAIPSTDIGTRMTLTREMIRSYVVDGNVKDWKPYLTVVGNYFKEKYPLESKMRQNDFRPYIFVIDEINRGEISKIFGELFFSIDPGYRGIKGRVKTQYTNLIPTGDVFKEGFYIPENVYIIGTMNDIDRSVDSFDFAMRRRFTWMEVTAAESAEQMKLPQPIIDRMTSLNDAISKTPELNPSYHIGGAYFLKLEKYDGDYEKLWQYHLEPLIHEYLRGIDGAEDHIKTLKKAYNLEKTNVDAEYTG